MKNRYVKLIIVIAFFLVLALVTSASYAYYVAYVNGNDSSFDNVITAGKMELHYQDTLSLALDNAYPTSSVEKEFEIKNTGDVETSYDVYLSELLNTFVDKHDLVYRIENISGNGCADNVQRIVPSIVGDESRVISSCLLSPLKTHRYKITVTFIDDGTNQDDNKGKYFNAKLSVNDYDDYKYAVLISGVAFNGYIKKLAGDNPSEEALAEFNEQSEIFNDALANPDRYPDSYYESFGLTRDNFAKDGLELYRLYAAAIYQSADDVNIKDIVVTNEKPDSNVVTEVVSASVSDAEILAWFDNGIIYLYTESNRIYFNSDATLSFSKLNAIESINLTNFDTSLVTNMNGMFTGCSSLESLDLTNFDTSNVMDMSGMFTYDAKISVLDLSSFDTSSVTKMKSMLAEMTSLKTVYVSNKWNPVNVQSDYMFNVTVNIVGGAGTRFTWDHIDAEYARVDDPQNGKPGYFTLRTN